MPLRLNKEKSSFFHRQFDKSIWVILQLKLINKIKNQTFYLVFIFFQNPLIKTINKLLYRSVCFDYSIGSQKVTTTVKSWNKKPCFWRKRKHLCDLCFDFLDHNILWPNKTLWVYKNTLKKQDQKKEYHYWYNNDTLYLIRVFVFYTPENDKNKESPYPEQIAFCLPIPILKVQSQENRHHKAEIRDQSL